MSANNFFEKYSIEEISKRTKISPISLRFIKNKEYDKIPRVKFIGFIKIIEREFNVNLNDLIQEYDTFNNISEPKKQEIKEKIEEIPKENEPKKEKNYLIFILGIALFIITALLLFKFLNNSLNSQTENNVSNITFENNITNEKNITYRQNITQEKNISQNTNYQNENNFTQNKNITIKTKNNETSTIIKTNIENNNSIKTNKITINEENKAKKAIPNQITIIPQKLLWYRIKNLDTNKTYEYLTSHKKTFNGKNFYIKFGHGEVTIQYGNETITPNTKKIVKILIKNGKYQYIKGKNK